MGGSRSASRVTRASTAHTGQRLGEAGLRLADSGAFLRPDDMHHNRDTARGSAQEEGDQDCILGHLLFPLLDKQSPLIARQLLDHFGSIAGVVAASHDALLKALQGEHRVASAICAARDLVEVGVRQHISRTAVRLDDEEFHRFLRLRLVSNNAERLLAVFVDGEGGIIRDEIVSEGDRFSLRFRAHVIIRRAFELDAPGIVLAHNHPSKMAFASEQDVTDTRRFQDLAASLGLQLIDHIIVTRKTTYSMRRAQMLCH